jgi:hypothetical protein
MRVPHILIIKSGRLAGKMVSAVLAICLCITSAFSKDTVNIIPAGNWAAVQNLKAGESMSIRLISGDRIEGEFLELDTEAIRMKVDKQEKAFPRESITEARQRVRDSKVNGILIGALAGGIAGGLVAKAAGTTHTGDTAARELGGAIIMAGVGLGALFGGITDAAIKGDKIIYRK